MKKFVAITLFLATTASFAGTCKIKARVYESNFSCPIISLNKFKDVSEDECQKLIKQAVSTNLFGLVKTQKGARLMHIDHTFKEGRYKVKDRLVLEDWNEVCMGGVL